MDHGSLRSIDIGEKHTVTSQGTEEVFPMSLLRSYDQCVHVQRRGDIVGDILRNNLCGGERSGTSRLRRMHQLFSIIEIFTVCKIEFTMK